ncbi:MAG: dTMP kinase [Gammaproteobacteria bacterium]|nr:dTMP kinase [Gammaproteobacteria bacterium]
MKDEVQGKFITIEGIEGVGKSTNIAFMTRLLRSAGKEVVVTREPGGTPFAERIRALLVDPDCDPCTPDTELLLMFASRAEHLAGKIWPALERGAWVVCDRFTDATFAYQGAGRGIESGHIGALEAWLQKGLRPHLTILLDADVQIGLERAGKRGELDRFEREELQFFDRVRAGYLDIAQREPERVKVVDASSALARVQEQIGRHLAALLEEADAAD